MKNSSNSSIDAYINLTKAIVSSAIKDGDRYFLNSEWGKFLVDSIREEPAEHIRTFEVSNEIQ